MEALTIPLAVSEGGCHHELAKLEAQGWVSSETIPQEGRPDKKLYRVTELGQKQLVEWVAKSCEPMATKDDLLVKVRAGYLVPRQVILEELERHRKVHQEKLSVYQDLEQQYSQNPQELPQDEKFRYLTLRRGIHYETDWLAWYDEVLQVLSDEALSVRVEPACPEDAAAIVEVHFAAVHQTAAPFYPEEIINSWSRPIIHERIERVQRAIASSSEVFLVAKSDNRVVGFGSVVPKNNELRGLYVHPAYGRCGIGAQLLSVLEQMAVEHGASCLQMDASVNAEAFYIRQGYQVVERGTHQLASGQEMDCVKMHKIIPH